MGAVARRGLFVAVVAVYCWLTAGTRPFSTAADMAVAVPLGAALGLAVVEARTGRPWGGPPPDRVPRPRDLWPWWVAVALLVGWELFNYFRGPRRSYPTVSSIYDHFARWQWAKGVVIAAWLGLGWAIVASFSRSPANRASRRGPPARHEARR